MVNYDRGITEKKLKIVYIIINGNLGGAQVHLYDLITSLPERYQVNVIMGQRLWLWDQLQTKDVGLHYVETLVQPISLCQDIKTIVSLRKIIQQLKPDVVHCHSSKAGFLGRIAGVASHHPVMFTAHGWAFSEGVSRTKRMLYRTLERISAQWTRKIICVSQYDRRLGEAAMPESRHKLITIYNGVRDIAVEPRKMQVNIHQDDALRVVMVARFKQPKDQAFLLQAVELVKKRNRKVQVTFVGEGPCLESVKRLAEELGLTDEVQFLGKRLDVGAILATQDVFVLISNWEGLPISILEAMQKGLPVIASNVGGVCETVFDGETGFLIPRGDVKLLAQRLQELHDNHAQRQRMGICGRRRFEKLFKLETMSQKTMDVYEEVLENL